MIQAAHVGVGISGQEGMQAANSADFSIAQFRFLLELLFVHGRNMHRRVATMVLYIFYKNAVMVSVTYYFLFVSAASGQRLYLEVASQMYTVLYTLLPSIFYCLVDRDVSDELSRRLPQLYHLGLRNVYFSGRVQGRWAVESLFESIGIFFLCVYAMPTLLPEMEALGQGQPTGQDPSIVFMGDMCFGSIVIVVSLKLLLEAYQLTILQMGSLLLGTGFWFLTTSLGSLVSEPSGFLYNFFRGYFGQFARSVNNPSYWLFLLLVPAATLTPTLFYRLSRRSFYPEFRDLVIEAAYLGDANALERLSRWEIPISQRRRSLVRPTCPTKRLRSGASTPQASRVFARHCRVGDTVSGCTD